jgi:predicted ATPase
MSETNDEVTPEGRLMADILQFWRLHGQWPEVEEFRGSHPGELPVIDALIEEESLYSLGTPREYHPTLKGLLLHGRQIAGEAFDVFDRVLPFLKKAYEQNPEKQWTVEEIGTLSSVPEEEVSRSLGLLLPMMAITVWRKSRLGMEGQPPRQQAAGQRSFEFSRQLLETPSFQSILKQLKEQEPLESPVQLSLLHVDGYRALEGFDAHLGPLTVLIGANATGKSSLLDFLGMLSFAAVNPLPPEVDPRSVGKRLFHSGAPERIHLSLRAVGNDGRTLQYVVHLAGPLGSTRVVFEQLVALAKTADEQEAISFEFLDFRSGKGSVRTQEASRHELILRQRTTSWTLPANELALRRALDPNLRVISGFREFVSSWRFYTGFDVGMTAALRRPALAEPEPWLREDGANLSAVLFHLMTERPERWGELETHLRSAIPSFQSLTVKARGGPGMVMGIWREEGVKDELTLADLSEGTLRFLCWMVLCLAPVRPPLICIDEPEVGLHPRVLPVLAGVLRLASTETQLLVTTHSPYFLSQFTLDEIAVMKKADGRAMFIRPSSNEALRQEVEELGSAGLAQLHLSDELEGRA